MLGCGHRLRHRCGAFQFHLVPLPVVHAQGEHLEPLRLRHRERRGAVQPAAQEYDRPGHENALRFASRLTDDLEPAATLTYQHRERTTPRLDIRSPTETPY